MTTSCDRAMIKAVTSYVDYRNSGDILLNIIDNTDNVWLALHMARLSRVAAPCDLAGKQGDCIPLLTMIAGAGPLVDNHLGRFV
jgi:hypothetical protein